MTESNENEIKVGYVGQILEGDDKDWYVYVQKPKDMKGYLIFIIKDITEENSEGSHSVSTGQPLSMYPAHRRPGSRVEQRNLEIVQWDDPYFWRRGKDTDHSL